MRGVAVARRSKARLLAMRATRSAEKSRDRDIVT